MGTAPSSLNPSTNIGEKNRRTVQLTQVGPVTSVFRVKKVGIRPSLLQVPESTGRLGEETEGLCVRVLETGLVTTKGDGGTLLEGGVVSDTFTKEVRLGERTRDDWDRTTLGLKKV